MDLTEQQYRIIDRWNLVSVVLHSIKNWDYKPRKKSTSLKNLSLKLSILRIKILHKMFNRY